MGKEVVHFSRAHPSAKSLEFYFRYELFFVIVSRAPEALDKRKRINAVAVGGPLRLFQTVLFNCDRVRSDRLLVLTTRWDTSVICRSPQNTPGLHILVYINSLLFYHLK